MLRRITLLVPWTFAFVLLAVGGGAHAQAEVHEPPRPNIVLFYVDDWGWTDAGFLGSGYYETPRMDGLAREGTVFTAAYSAGPNCAPSRASLMSGQYTPRHGVYTVSSSARGKAKDRKLIPIENRTELADEVVTLAEALRDAGYVTASMGKWHLGADPRTQGFDINVAGNQTGSPRGGYFSPYKNPELSDGPEGEYLTDRLTDEALAFLEARGPEPFFLYLTHYAVHSPLQCKDEHRAKYAAKQAVGGHDNTKYAGMVESTDESLGRVLDKLAELDLAQNTIVILHSDNGGYGGATSNAPLRGVKGMLYEGGIRVPLVMRWPGHIAQGGRTAVPVHGVDLYPTMLELAGAAPPAGQPLDGVSLTPLFAPDGTLERDALFWHFPAYLQATGKGNSPWRTTPVGAVRQGPLKLLEYFEDGRLELYDLDGDPGETHNLAAQRPEDTARLHALLGEWRTKLGAPVPTAPNPEYVPPPTPDAPEGADETAPAAARRPNVVYILADDLGYGELGCYGQDKIRTPHLDRLATEGMRFTQHYAGSPVCAPSRCVLLTGRHTGHAIVRDNSAWFRKENPHGEGQFPLPAETTTLATLLQREGYATAAIGKWGLGGPDNEGEPNRQGFDHFFGYLCQAHAHNYYPTHLWRNGEKVPIDNPVFSAHEKLAEPPADAAAFARFSGRQYAPDLMIEEALGFVRDHAQEPFFLYFATPVPHAALQVPSDSLAAYPEAWDDAPYLGQKGYTPHPRPRAAYAAMVTRMDEHVGRLLALLDELGIGDDTIVMFASDNGPTFNGGTDSEFFASAGGMRGLKASVFEGGIRVPMIARWRGRIAPGATSDHVSGFQDVLPTVLDLLGGAIPGGLDGITFAPTLVGRGEEQRTHDERTGELYWELGRQQALRAGDWKLVRRTDRQGKTETMLFDLARDPGEMQDLAATRPEVLAALRARIRAAREPSPTFPSPFDDGE